MDSLTTGKKAIPSCPTRPPTSAVLLAPKVACRILGSADAGMRPRVAQASHARTSMRSQSSNRCWSAHTARMAGGAYRSITQAAGLRCAVGDGDDYKGDRLRV